MSLGLKAVWGNVGEKKCFFFFFFFFIPPGPCHRLVQYYLSGANGHQCSLECKASQPRYLQTSPFGLSISSGVEPCARDPWEWGALLGWTSLLWFTIFLIDAFPVSLVTYPALCLLLTHDDSLILGGDALLCPPVTVTHGSLCPFVSCGLGCPMPSRLALDDAIRHKPLNMSSRFSPRVAGENDFLQTVINKVIAAKEVNHKGQGMYLCCFCCGPVGNLGWNFWDWVMLVAIEWTAFHPQPLCSEEDGEWDVGGAIYEELSAEKPGSMGSSSCFDSPSYPTLPSPLFPHP